MKLSNLILLGSLAGGITFAQGVPKPPAAPAAAPAPAAISTNTPIGQQPRDPKMQRLLNSRSMPEMTPEQQTKFQEANNSYREMTAPAEEKLFRVRRELEAAVNAEKLDEAGIRAKAQQLATIEGDLAVARALRLSKLRGFLSAEQVARLSGPQAGMRPNAFPRAPMRPMPTTPPTPATPAPPAPAATEK